MDTHEEIADLRKASNCAFFSDSPDISGIACTMFVCVCVYVCVTCVCVCVCECMCVLIDL